MQVQIYTTLKKILLLTGQSAYMILIKQTQVTVFTKLFTNHLSFDKITMRVGQPLPALIWGPGPRLFYLNAGLLDSQQSGFFCSVCSGDLFFGRCFCLLIRFFLTNMPKLMFFQFILLSGQPGWSSVFPVQIFVNV